MKQVLILNNDDIDQKTVRIAYQIIEHNYEEKELIFIGIEPNGLQYAEKLKKEVERINGVKVTLTGMKLDKKNPLKSDVQLQLPSDSLNGKTIVLIDDVANTGKTMFYAIKPLLEASPKKVLAVVLVDRQHKLFPITPDFVGLSLSTTLQEHITVDLSNPKKAAAYLV